MNKETAVKRASELTDESATLPDHPVEATGAERSASHEACMTRLRSIIAMHSHAVADMDDSRESIFAGREEPPTFCAAAFLRTADLVIGPPDDVVAGRDTRQRDMTTSEYLRQLVICLTHSSTTDAS